MAACVLVADANADVRMILSRYLTKAGFVVVTAPDVNAAIEAARGCHPDCVLLDLDLATSRGHGRELLAALRSRAAAPQVYMITHYDDPFTQELVERLGVNGMLTVRQVVYRNFGTALRRTLNWAASHTTLPHTPPPLV